MRSHRSEDVVASEQVRTPSQLISGLTHEVFIELDRAERIAESLQLAIFFNGQIVPSGATDE